MQKSHWRSSLHLLEQFMRKKMYKHIYTPKPLDCRVLVNSEPILLRSFSLQMISFKTRFRNLDTRPKVHSGFRAGMNEMTKLIAVPMPGMFQSKIIIANIMFRGIRAEAKTAIVCAMSLKIYIVFILRHIWRI